MTLRKDEATSPVLEVKLDSEVLGKEAYNDIMHESMLPIADISPVRPSRGSPPQSETKELMHAFNLGEVACTLTRAKSRVFCRSRKHIAGSDMEDFYVLPLYYKGVGYYDDGRSVVISNSACSLIDLSHPLSGHTSDGAEAYYLVFPKPLLRQYGYELSTGGGHIIAGNDPRSAILLGAIHSAHSNFDKLRPGEEKNVTDALMGLVSHIMGAGHDNQQARSAALSSMMAYIDAHLHDPALGTDTLVRAFHRSRATIYRLFAEEGGIFAYIQRRRLHACYRELTYDMRATRRIVDVALSWGFTNHSHFTRIFREHYGIAPSSLRDAVLAEELGTVDHNAQRYSEHINNKRLWMFHSI
ncbi:MAG: helix-turn-helix domain-containing protein [Chromatiales bacterium]|nr:helix-turn-helix domain-containing protein [Chromatiales bacterium]